MIFSMLNNPGIYNPENIFSFDSLDDIKKYCKDNFEKIKCVHRYYYNDYDEYFLYLQILNDIINFDNNKYYLVLPYFRLIYYQDGLIDIHSIWGYLQPNKFIKTMKKVIKFDFRMQFVKYKDKYYDHISKCGCIILDMLSNEKNNLEDGFYNMVEKSVFLGIHQILRFHCNLPIELVDLISEYL